MFVQVLGLWREAGLVKLVVVTPDGTKVAANAALEGNRSYHAVTGEVRRMLVEARTVDAEEDADYGQDRRGDEWPEGLGRRGDRLHQLQEAQARLEREAKEAAQAAQELLLQRQVEEAATGK